MPTDRAVVCIGNGVKLGAHDAFCAADQVVRIPFYPQAVFMNERDKSEQGRIE